jgi:hypothetical protein
MLFFGFLILGSIFLAYSQGMVREEYITHAGRHTPRGSRRVYVDLESFAELKLKFNQPHMLNIFARLCGKSVYLLRD